MANDLSTRAANPREVISSQALQKLRRISIGTVQWPGQPTKTYLPAGSTLSTEDRAQAEQVLEQLRAREQANDAPETRKQRLAIVAKMLLAYPVAGASTEAGRARAEAYLDALDDVPPWAISEAVKRWHRGQCGDNHDYRWAPAPAVLRLVSLEQLVPVRAAADHIAGLLAAVPLDEAMRSGPAKHDPYVVDGFKKLSEHLHTGKRPETVIAEDRMRNAAALGRQADKLAEEQSA